MDANSGAYLSMGTFHHTIRELVIEARAAEDACLVTSKSFRMFGVTLADVRGADWSERLALGNWCEVPGGSAGGQRKQNVIPVRYSGDRENSAAFVKLMQVNLVRTAYEVHITKFDEGLRQGKVETLAPLTWTIVRSILPGIDAIELTTKVTATMCASTAREAMLGVKQPVVRAFSIPDNAARTHVSAENSIHEYLAKKQLQGSKPSQDQSEGEAQAQLPIDLGRGRGKATPPPDDDEDEDENSSDTDSTVSEDKIVWIHRNLPKAPVHLESNLDDVPVCYFKAGTQLKKPFARGDGLAGLAKPDRPVCMKCLAGISSRTAAAVRRLRKEKGL